MFRLSIVDRPYMAAEVGASQLAGLMGRRVFFNYMPMHSEVRWSTLLDAYLIETVNPHGYDSEMVEVVFCDEDGDGQEQSRQLSTVASVLVQVTSEEWKSVSYFPCGPYMSHWRWHPEPHVSLKKHSGSTEFSTVRTETGDQFLLPI